MNELHGLEVDVEAMHNGYIQNQDLRVLLFQVVRELLFNVKKHAGVDRALVRLTEEAAHLVIHVIDSGTGFDVDTVTAGDEHKGRFGLFSVRERLNLLGGRMEVRSQPKGGTHVKIYMPIKFTCP
jgi:signal transduction histidine kinase